MLRYLWHFPIQSGIKSKVLVTCSNKSILHAKHKSLGTRWLTPSSLVNFCFMVHKRLILLLFQVGGLPDLLTILWLGSAGLCTKKKYYAFGCHPWNWGIMLKIMLDWRPVLINKHKHLIDGQAKGRKFWGIERLTMCLSPMIHWREAYTKPTCKSSIKFLKYSHFYQLCTF